MRLLWNLIKTVVIDEETYRPFEKNVFKCKKKNVKIYITKKTIVFKFKLGDLVSNTYDWHFFEVENFVPPTHWEQGESGLTSGIF